MSNDQAEWQQRHDQQRAEELAQVIEPRPEAVAAAKWWGEQLRSGNPGTAGDPHVDGMLSWARSAAGAKHACPDEKITNFETALARRIEAEISRRATEDPRSGKPEWSWYVTLSVDYGPDMDLGEAARTAGISDGNPSLVFPVKTCMWIDRGRVKVRAGYGAADRTVGGSTEGVEHWAALALTKCAEELDAIRDGIRK